MAAVTHLTPQQRQGNPNLDGGKRHGDRRSQ